MAVQLYDDVRAHDGAGAPLPASVKTSPDATDDGLRAELAWRAGHPIAAIEAADRALVGGTDPGGRAAGVAAAAAAADGALLDAATRWRGVAVRLEGGHGVRAGGHAALAAGLAGDLDAATRDLTDAALRLPDPAPRGLAVLLAGVDATMTAVRGDFDRAARLLAGLAATTVPPDPLAPERWDELAATVVAAGGDDDAARAMLGGPPRRSGAENGAGTAPCQHDPRHQLLAAWLDMRSGRLASARDGLKAAAGTPALRRNAVLAAAVTVGLARRSGDGKAMASTWHRLAPVVAGADVELLLLDVWGELSVGAARVSPTDCATIVAAMRAAVAMAGSPPWCLAAEQWWRFERALATADMTTAADAAEQLTASAGHHHRLSVLAGAATTWSAVLRDDAHRAGDAHRAAVARAVTDLVAVGRPWEATVLCRAAADRATDPATARQLLGACRGLVAGAPPGGTGTAHGLSEREREVGALIVDGLTHKEIGARLYISPKTVEQHVARLRQKLAAGNRAALVAALRACLGG